VAHGNAIGNAVPSLIAEVLAREIRRQFFGAPLKKPLNLLPPKRENVPPPVQVARLPKKYHEHTGHHEAHPGEGKGRLAVKLRAELESAE
jgi:DNA (cytosine-5)-methyltransferase 1